MRELLQSIFNTTEERVKNPIVGAFMTSWILINWRPLTFFFLSDRKIEDKINYIGTNFSGINDLLWFPLCAVIFYLLAVPYLGLFLDNLLKASLFKRNEIVINRKLQSIDNEKRIAIEEIKLEESKTQYRERNTHNKLVEELQIRNENLEKEMASLSESNRTVIEQLKLELTNRDKMTNEELSSFERRFSESRREIIELNDRLLEKDQEIQELSIAISNYKLQLNDSRRSNVGRNMVIKFQNGLIILETFDGKNFIYKNLETMISYTVDEVHELMKKFTYESYDL